MCVCVCVVVGEWVRVGSSLVLSLSSEHGVAVKGFKGGEFCITIA